MKVIIHDNFKALERFAQTRGMQAAAHNGLINFNGRFIVFQIDGVSFISTGMGSAQTNALIESLSRKQCQAVVKVGTCSALDDRLCEGNIIAPYGALVDEGATPWRHVKAQHDTGLFNTQKSVDEYIGDRQFVQPHDELRERVNKKHGQTTIHLV